MINSNIEIVNVNPDKIVQALAEVWRIHLEAETGRKVTVTVRKEEE